MNIDLIKKEINEIKTNYNSILQRYNNGITYTEKNWNSLSEDVRDEYVNAVYSFQTQLGNLKSEFEYFALRKMSDDEITNGFDLEAQENLESRKETFGFVVDAIETFDEFQKKEEQEAQDEEEER